MIRATPERPGDGSPAAPELRIDGPNTAPDPSRRTTSRSAKLGRYRRRPEAPTERRRADGDHVRPLIGRASALLLPVTTTGLAHRLSWYGTKVDACKRSSTISAEHERARRRREAP